MMKSLLLLASALLLSGCAPVPSTSYSIHSLAQQRGVDNERQRLYDWFDGLGFDAMRSAPFGRLDAMRLWRENDPRSTVEYGFLVEGEGSDFTFLGLGVDKEAFVNGKFSKGNEGFERARFTALDLGRWLREQEAAESSEYYQTGFSPRAQSFLYSRLAAVHGYGDVADAFYKNAKEAYVFEEYERGKSFEYQVQEDIGDHLLQHVIDRIEISSETRESLLPDLQFIVDKFPTCRSRNIAADHLDNLKRMIAEEKAHKALSPAEVDHLPEEQQVAELIFRLRDQSGEQGTEPGYCSMLGPFGIGFETQPAYKLIQLNFAAVPQLLDALHDRRLTRAVQGGMHNNHPWILRYRDAAIQVLRAISGQRFSPADEGVPSDDDKQAAGIEAKARNWWRLASAKGERQWLIGRLESRAEEWDSGRLAARLVRKFPDSWGSIRVGVRKATDGRNRGEMIAALDKTDTPSVRLFLREELADAKAEARLAAAKLVYKFDRQAALRAMAREWQRVAKYPGEDDYFVSQLAAFLTDSKSLASLEAFSSHLRSSFTLNRYRVAEALGGGWSWGIPPQFRPLPPNPNPDQRQYAKRLETILIGLVSDEGYIPGMMVWQDEHSIPNARVCDVAAYGLSRYWPSKYLFDESTSTAARDALRARFINIWRRSQGFPAVPPRPAEHGFVLAKNIGPLLKAIDGEDPVARQKAVARIQEIGLPALRPLRDYSLTASSADARRDLDRLALRIGTIVRDVKIQNAPEGVHVMSGSIYAWKGKPLTTTAIRKLISAAVRTWPAPRLGFTLLITRDPDLRGVLVTLEFNRPVAESSGGGYAYEIEVTLDARNLTAGFGSTGASDITNNWHSFYGAIDEALAAPPWKPLSIYLTMNRDKR